MKFTFDTEKTPVYIGITYLPAGPFTIPESNYAVETRGKDLLYQYDVRNAPKSWFDFFPTTAPEFTPEIANQEAFEHDPDDIECAHVYHLGSQLYEGPPMASWYRPVPKDAIPILALSEHKKVGIELGLVSDLLSELTFLYRLEVVMGSSALPIKGLTENNGDIPLMQELIIDAMVQASKYGLKEVTTPTRLQMRRADRA